MPTIEVNFDEPRQGPICYAADAGDAIKFVWHEQHNLHRMPDRASYEACSFGSAERLANAGPNAGVVVDFDGTDAYFSCSKICASNGHKVRVCLNGESSCSSCCGFVAASNSSSLDASPPSCPPPLGPAPIGTLYVLLIIGGVIALVVVPSIAFYRRCRDPKPVGQRAVV